MSKSMLSVIVMMAGISANSSAFAQVAIVNNGPYLGTGPQVVVDQSINIIDNSQTIYDESETVIDNRRIYEESHRGTRKYQNLR